MSRTMLQKEWETMGREWGWLPPTQENNGWQLTVFVPADGIPFAELEKELLRQLLIIFGSYRAVSIHCNVTLPWLYRRARKYRLGSPWLENPENRR